MIVAGMHGTSARNLAINTLPIVTGVNAGILLFPQTVSESDLEIAFEGDYSSFIQAHCVGYINCVTSIINYDEFTDIKFNAVDYECSGVSYVIQDVECIAEDETKSMVAVDAVTFYYPRVFKYEDLSYSGGTSSSAYTVAQINAVASDYDTLFDLESAATINRLMTVDSTSPSVTLLRGRFSSNVTRVYKDLIYYRFDTEITVDTLVTRFSMTGASPVSSNAAIQLFAKVDGSWVIAFTSTYEALSRDVPLVRKFAPVTASEWRIGLYGHVASSISQSTYLNLLTLMLGNSEAALPDSSIIVDKAVIVPAASLSKYSDAKVEAASNIPAIVMPAGVSEAVGLFSQTLKVGERIPFIEAVLRLGVQ